MKRIEKIEFKNWHIGVLISVFTILVVFSIVYKWVK